MRSLVLVLLIFSYVVCEKVSEAQGIVTKTSQQGSAQSTDNLVSDKENAKLIPKKPVSDLKTDLSAYKTMEWIELIPKDDLEALLAPPDYLSQIEDGSMADRIESQIQSSMTPQQSGDDRYQQALISTNIIEALNGKKARIPGFVVPLEFNDDQVVKSFFLVPYFGACIHSPPPPPNQIIYVQDDAGIVLESLYEPIWISGTLTTDLFEDQMGTAAYILSLDYIESFDESDY